MVDRFCRFYLLIFAKFILPRLAKESLEADLPEGWEMEIMEEGEHAGTPYYFNEELGESMWEHPKDEFYRTKYLELKSKRGKRGGGIQKDDDPKSFQKAQRKDEELTAEREDENKRVNITQHINMEARLVFLFWKGIMLFTIQLINVSHRNYQSCMKYRIFLYHFSLLLDL